VRRVLLVSYHFPPSPHVGALRPGRFARLLPSYGYVIDVICAANRHADPTASASLLDDAGDISVRRVDAPFILGRDPRSGPPSEGGWPRFWWKTRGYAEWCFLTRDWTWAWGKAAGDTVARILRSEQYDAVVLDAPPTYAISESIAIAKREGVPIVLDLRDLWPTLDGSGSALPVLHPRGRRKAWSDGLRDEALRNADHVVVTSEPAAQVMGTYMSDDERSDITVVYNAYDLVDEETTDLPSPVTPLTMVYTGSLAYGRHAQVQSLIRGMAEARRRGGPDVRLTVAGPDAGGLQETARAEGMRDRIQTIGWLAHGDVVQLQREASALLLLQSQESQGTRVAIPGKLYEYMGRRRNIFGMVGSSPSVDIITKHSLGVCVPRESPDAIADALAMLADRVSTRPTLPRPPEEFSAARTTRAFADVLDQVLG
jgi:glycosyltransferase involved in cell wall biosynthesis